MLNNFNLKEGRFQMNIFLNPNSWEIHVGFFHNFEAKNTFAKNYTAVN
jgi:hypothetical protein